MQSNFPKMPLFFSIIFFIFSSLAFVFLYKEVNNNNQKSQLGEKEWQAEALRRDEVKTLDSSIKAIEKERALLETHFARSSDIVPFLDTVEGLAPKAGVKAEVTSVDVLSNSNGLVVGMKASGTFNGLYKFLILLENSPYELEFISMNMQSETVVTVSNTEDKNALVPKWNTAFKIKLLSFL